MTKTPGQIAYEAYRQTCCGPQAVTWQEYIERGDTEEIEGWEAGAEEAFSAGIDEAVRQANAELARLGISVQLINAGLNTVCATDPNPSI
jgi:hypothetical protein